MYPDMAVRICDRALERAVVMVIKFFMMILLFDIFNAACWIPEVGMGSYVNWIDGWKRKLSLAFRQAQYMSGC